MKEFTLSERTKARIKARCESYNIAHRMLIEAFPDIMAWVKSMEGQQIFGSTVGLLAKFRKTKPDIPFLYIEVGDYSIRAFCQSGNCVGWTRLLSSGRSDSGHESGGHSLYFADVTNGIVSIPERYLVPPAERLRTDYAPEPIFEAIIKAEALKNQIDECCKGHHEFINERVELNYP